jgi:hypothetical protein
MEPTQQFWQNPSRWAYLILAPWVIGVVFMINQSRRQDHVAARQRTAQGTIVAHESQNHDRYGYSFSVEGRVYRGWDSPVNRAFTLGERVQVYYDPADPEINALQDFAQLSLNALAPVLLVGFASVGLFGAIFVVRRRAKLGQPL